MLARATRQRTWWSAYQSKTPAPYLEFIGAESDATRIRHYHPTLVPGLLQTKAYAKAIIEATALDELPPDLAAARNEVRALRQENVLNRDGSPALTVILDEAVLRRPVGGPDTMREQLDHLLRLAARDTITMVVVPFSAGPHPGLLGAFALMEYDDPANDDVLCLETASGNVLLRDQPELISQYRRMAERLLALALSERDAVRLVEEVRDGLH